ncbi:putative cytochrome P450 hydroxylase [Paenibacillus sp. JCM 10914]|nr:putative cytochrome P450 hydroxylase [Paenibacillus sp. JCM 10914]
MNNEIISLEDITQFQSPTEEFNPYVWYKHKLQHEPISYNEATDTWNAFRYQDVKRVLSDYEHFSNVRTRTTISVGADNDEGKHMGKFNLMTDPPEHRKSRSLLAAAFTPRSLKLWEPRIQEIVSELIQEIKEAEQIDVVKDFASALPTIVISDLLGVPWKTGCCFRNGYTTCSSRCPKRIQKMYRRSNARPQKHTIATSSLISCKRGLTRPMISSRI